MILVLLSFKTPLSKQQELQEPLWTGQLGILEVGRTSSMLTQKATRAKEMAHMPSFYGQMRQQPPHILGIIFILSTSARMCLTKLGLLGEHIPKSLAGW